MTLRSVTSRAKGVVDPATARQMLRLDRYQPAPDLAPFLDYHWVVEWDLRGRPDFVQRTLPYPVVNALLARVQEDATLTRVDELAERAALSMRTLQAWFSDYVGVSPKWVIRRYRLHEAADQLAHGVELDLAELAQRLGYYDQSHLTRDFSRLVGKPPQAYRGPPR